MLPSLFCYKGTPITDECETASLKRIGPSSANSVCVCVCSIFAVKIITLHVSQFNILSVLRTSFHLAQNGIV